MLWILFLTNTVILAQGRVLNPRNRSSQIDFFPGPPDVGQKERIIIAEEDDGHKVDMFLSS